MKDVMENGVCTIDTLVDRIVRARMQAPRRRSLLVAISGIDGSGKGYVAQQLEQALEAEGYRVATIDVDDWLERPATPTASAAPVDRYYQDSASLDDLFRVVVRPLRDRRSVRAEAHGRGAAAFDDVDIVLLEGNFLLKWEFFPLYDLSVWIECSFSTALERAIARVRGAVPPDETVWTYHRTYFPAQRLHLQLDNPRRAATFVLRNDRLIE